MLHFFYVAFAAALLSVASAGAPSPDASCGGVNGYTCQGTQWGNCCSQYGWCGSSSVYCGTGCQPGFGTCGSGPSSTLSTSTIKATTTSKTSTSTTKTTTSSATPTSPTLADCLGSKNVPVYFLSSPQYSQAAKPYNVHLAYKPSVVVIPTTMQHVSDAVVCAGKSKVKVQAKGGGHSYASYSTGGQDGTMVIDLQSFQTVAVDKTSNIATVGGGVRLGNLAQGIYDQNKRALPHGTCPGVGIGGHATHGGFGYSSRAWGLSLDHILGLDVVLANGSAVYASATTYPDVYYALRGAADSFGIVTTFHMATVAAPASVVYFSFTFDHMFNDATKPASLMLHLQDFGKNASVVDRKLGFGVYLDGTGFSLSGTYFGTQADFAAKVQPELLRSLPAPGSSTVQTMTWIDSLTKLAGQPLPQPTTNYDQHDNFYAKSLVVPETGPFTLATLKSYFQYIIDKGKGAAAPAPWFAIINLYGGADSQINVPLPTSSAYGDRSSLWVLQHYARRDASAGPFPDTTVDPFLDGMNSAIASAQPGTAFSAYLNYVDPRLTPSQAHELYYGSATYARLLGIKKVVDPGSVFWNPQAVGT